MQTQPSNLRPTNVPARDDEQRPLGTIIAELWENTEQLARQEIKLGLSQLDDRVDHIKADLTRVTLGGAVLYAGLLSLVAAVVLLLAKVVDPWLAALITGAAVSITGYALLMRGKNRLADDIKPKRDSHNMHQGHSFKEALK